MPESYIVIGKMAYIRYSASLLDDVVSYYSRGYSVFLIERIGIVVTGTSVMQVSFLNLEWTLGIWSVGSVRSNMWGYIPLREKGTEDIQTNKRRSKGSWSTIRMWVNSSISLPCLINTLRISQKWRIRIPKYSDSLPWTEIRTLFAQS